MYAKETDRGVKEEILNAYFIGGDAKDLYCRGKGREGHGVEEEGPWKSFR